MIPADRYSYPAPTGDYADIRDFHERVGRAIMQVLALSHRIAITSRPDGEPLSTLDDLRQIRDTVADAQDDAAPLLAQVGLQSGNIWAWFRYLIAEGFIPPPAGGRARATYGEDHAAGIRR